MQSCSRTTAQNFAGFAQNLEICTPKLEKSCIFTISTFFLRVFTPVFFTFQFFWRIFLRKTFKSKILTAQEYQLLECLAGGGRCVTEQADTLELEEVTEQSWAEQSWAEQSWRSLSARTARPT